MARVGIVMGLFMGLFIGIKPDAGPGVAEEHCPKWSRRRVRTLFLLVDIAQSASASAENAALLSAQMWEVAIIFGILWEFYACYGIFEQLAVVIGVRFEIFGSKIVRSEWKGVVVVLCVLRMVLWCFSIWFL